MRMMTISRAVLLALAVAACGGGTSPGTTPDTTPSPAIERAFTEDELESIALQQQDVPPDVALCEECSGELSLDDLAEDDEEKKKLTDLGFEAGYGTAFATEGVLEAQDEASLPEDGTMIVSVLTLVRDEDAANAAKDFIVEDTKADGTDITTFDASAVADGAIGLEGGIEDFPYPGRMVAWTQGNLLLVVGTSDGGDDQTDVIALAQKMNARTRG